MNSTVRLSEHIRDTNHINFISDGTQSMQPAIQTVHVITFKYYNSTMLNIFYYKYILFYFIFSMIISTK